MVRIALLLLIVFSSIAFGDDRKVCVINSYKVPPALELEKNLLELLKERGYLIALSGKECDIKLVIGTPALVESLKRDRFSKLIYTFVLFPEKFPVNRENVYGIRIFPLPERTVKAFMKKKGLEKVKVAVPVSRKMVPIAKRYLPEEYFRLIVFRSTPTEVFNRLSRYRYVYIFPDPKLLRFVNLLNLINFGKENDLVFLTGLGDLKRYGVDFVQEVSYEKLAAEMVKLIESKPKEKILPCPVKE
ncbi:hypothetical protein [Thermovibrio sp.]